MDVVNNRVSLVCRFFYITLRKIKIRIIGVVEEALVRGPNGGCQSSTHLSTITEQTQTRHGWPVGGPASSLTQLGTIINHDLT